MDTGDGMELGEIYAETRVRIGELLRSLSAEEQAAKLPTCPEWSSRDVVGHMAGLVVDVTTRRLEGAGTPAWTQAQVDAFRDRSTEEVLADWEAVAKEAEGDLEGVLGPFAVRLVSDAYSHEHDIRGATGRPGHRDAAALPVAMTLQLEMLGQRLADGALPALRLRAADGAEWTVGEGPPAATVTAPSAWELLRAVTARRSRSQVAALGWEGDGPGRYIDSFFRFDPPGRDIVE